MTPTARVAADIEAMLLGALMTQTPIPGDRVDGLVAYIATNHATVPRAIIESLLPPILEAHAVRARVAGDVYLEETNLLIAELRRRMACACEPD
jgi:hypothetical protein